MQKTVLFIAWRYLFSKKSHNAINWVSGISMAGVAVATAAMVCVMSVFNGFRAFVETLFTAFDPDVRIELAEGKTVAADDPTLLRLRASDKVAVYTEVLEEKALLKYGERQTVITLRGVSDNFAQLIGLDSNSPHSILIPDYADFFLKEEVEWEDDINSLNSLNSLNDLDELFPEDSPLPIGEGSGERPFAYLGVGVARQIGLPLLYGEELELWAPKHGQRVNMGNPASSFRRDYLCTPGAFFCVRQPVYDANMVICPLDFAQSLFDNEGRVSHIELRLAKGAGIADIRAMLDSRFRALDRYEQQADSFRIMNIEKLMAYIFLSFILLVAAFNIVGSLSMLIIEKRDDAHTLRALGASDGTVRRIFATEGRLISLLGAVIGLVVGLLLCWLQMQFGLISLGGSEGTFIMDSYPVKVELGDLLLVLATVVATSWLTILWPTARMGNKS